ncbi:hypothetical protein [Asanoa sp. NPDC050611]|uniref:hypothetical protein n=1 Tax=Asanoa sp. NPDC050611 TaxID=3157098 RepID=UPI0033CA6448
MSTVIAVSDLAKDSVLLDQGALTSLLAAFAGLVLIGSLYDLIDVVGKAFTRAALGTSALLTVMVVMAVVVVRA